MKNFSIKIISLTLALLAILIAPLESLAADPISYEVLVPNQIIMINATQYRNDHTLALTEGIKGISKFYYIENIVPLTNYIATGSQTNALIVFVKPKKK